MKPIFKANDVRGIYPLELNEKEVRKIGLALGNYFKLKASARIGSASGGKNLNLKPVLIIGHDARLSSPSLYRELIAGIKNKELGIRNKRARIIHNSKFIIHEAGLMTTPMLYFLVADNKADGGIMVTASHNPKEYNGLKVVKKGAQPMGGEEIEKMVISPDHSRGADRGRLNW